MMDEANKALPNIGSISLMILCVCICAVIFKYHNKIFDKLIMINPHYLILQENIDREKLVEGTSVVEIGDLEGASGRAMEQGGATLVYMLPNKMEKGSYYCRLAGNTMGKADMLTVKATNADESYLCVTNWYLTKDETEYTYIMTIEEECSKLSLVWNNSENVPIITDFQIRRLPDSQDMEQLQVGVAHRQKAQEHTLTEKEKIYEGSITHIIESKDNIVLASNKEITILGDTGEKKYNTEKTINNISTDADGNIYAILDNGDIEQIHLNGRCQVYDYTLFGEKPVNVNVLGEYWFVSEGYGGMEIFKCEEGQLSYMSNILLNNKKYINQVGVYNHAAYVLGSGNVYWYDIENIMHPYPKGVIYNAGNATDLKFVGNKLYVSIVNHNENIDKDGSYSGEKGTGYFEYKGSLAGILAFSDGWKQDGFDADGDTTANLDVYGNEVCYSLTNGGVRIRTSASVNNETESINIVLRINDLDGKEVNAADAVMTSQGIYVLADNGDVYFWEDKNNKRKMEENSYIKCEEKREKYTVDITVLDEDTEYTSYCLEDEKIVKHLAIVQNYLVMGYQGGFCVYDIDTRDKLWESGFQLGGEWEDYTFLEGIRDNRCLLGKDDRIVLYHIENGSMIEGRNIVSDIGRVNGAYETESGEILLYGEDGLALYSSELEIKNKWHGTEIRKVEHESQNGYFLLDTEWMYWYLNKENMGKGLQRLNILDDYGDLGRDYGHYYLQPLGKGYGIVSDLVYENEDGVFTTKKIPQVDYIGSWDEIEWYGFLAEDMHWVRENVYVDVNATINKLFFLDISDVNNPKIRFICKSGYKIYDAIMVDEKLIIAIGRGGVVIIERKQ